MVARWALSGALCLFLLTGSALAGSITTQQQAVPATIVVAVDQTATDISIHFNTDGVADPAGLVTLWNKAGNGVYCVDRGTATVVGAPLEAGQTFTFNYRGTSSRVTQLSCIANVGESATLHVWAIP